MGMTNTFKLVFTGPMGAGKTTAIAAISDTPPVCTEVENGDRDQCDKATTTVGMDLGRITLEGDQVVQLYGTPGQERFRLMWSILARGAAGVLILLDATQTDVLKHLDHYLEAFEPLVPANAIVVGLGRTEYPGSVSSDQLCAHLQAQGRRLPVFSVDVRQADDVRLLVRTLISILSVALPETTHE